MPPGITWHEEDTDSEQGGDIQGSSSSSGRRTPDTPQARPEERRALSPEEFGRMQDEFLALKMHNQELLEERRRLHGSQQGANTGFPPGVSGVPQGASNAQGSASMLTAAALGRSFSAQMKVNTRAISASLQSTLAKNGMLAQFSDAGPQMLGGEDAAADERRTLREEAEALRSRIRAALEEAEEFRTVANDARQVVAVEKQARRELKLALPALSDIRQGLAGGAVPADEESEVVQCLDDEQLLHITCTVVQLLNRQRGDDGELTGSAGPDSRGAALLEETDEDRVLLQRKIDSQQQELDRLMGIFHEQQAQIMSLRDQLMGKDDPDKKKQAKERLRNAERHMEGLTKQLEVSEEGAKQSHEIRVQLRTLAMQAVERDQVLAEMRSLFDVQAEEATLLLERLQVSLADLCGHEARRADQRTAARVPRPPPARASGAAKATKSAVASIDTSVSKAADSCTPADVSTNVEIRDVEAQAELCPDGTVTALMEGAQLRAEIEDLQIEKALLEKRTDKQLEELRGLVEPPRFPAQRAPEPAEAKASGVGTAKASAAAKARAAAKASAAAKARAVAMSAAEDSTCGTAAHMSTTSLQPETVNKVLCYDISSDGEEEGTATGKRGWHPASAPDSDDEVALVQEYSAGMLYVQKVADLEQRNEILRQELEFLHDSERVLQVEKKEKNELLARLLQQVKLPSRSSGESEQERGFWRHSRRHGDPGGASRDLERTIEETQEDNIRLRNDIRVMAEEFRKVLSGMSQSKPRTG